MCAFNRFNTCTGCGPTAAMVCGDKQATMDVIEEMGEDSGVITLPTRLLMVEELLAAGSDMFACKKMVGVTFGSWL
eukprot:1161296-Pelagomonas_calceolata.AAC.19